MSFFPASDILTVFSKHENTIWTIFVVVGTICTRSSEPIYLRFEYSVSVILFYLMCLSVAFLFFLDIIC